MISGSFIYKVPQIIKILKAGSTQGIQASSIYFESLVFVHTLSYSRHLNLDLSVYGENIIILVQQVVILLLIYHYDPDVSLIEKIVFVAFFASYPTWLIMDTAVPETVWPMIPSSCLLFNILSRIPLIYSNFTSKSTGVLSFITFLLAWGGAVARLATVLIESDDPLYKAQFIMSTCLNTMIMIQFGLYWNSDKN